MPKTNDEAMSHWPTEAPWSLRYKLTIALLLAASIATLFAGMGVMIHRRQATHKCECTHVAITSDGTD